MEVFKMTGRPYLIVRSVTQAFRAREVLAKAHIYSDIERTPSFLVGRGCSYCVRVPAGRIQQVVNVLQHQPGLDFMIFGERGERIL